jgi:hypothetical protein
LFSRCTMIGTAIAATPRSMSGLRKVIRLEKSE